MRKRNPYKLLSTAIRISSQRLENLLDIDGSPLIMRSIQTMFKLRRDDPESLSAAILNLSYQKELISEKELIDEGFTDKTIDILNILKLNDDNELDLTKWKASPDAVRVKMAEILVEQNNENSLYKHLKLIKNDTLGNDYYSINKSFLLAKAIRIAAEAHEGVLDKGGNPYILHPFRIMFRLRSDDFELLMIAVMHDVTEDTDWTNDALKKEGFSKRVLRGLHLLHHEHGIAYNVYVEAIGAELDSILVKMEDLRDNTDITRLKGVSEKDLERTQKYHVSYIYLKNKKEALINIKK